MDDQHIQGGDKHSLLRIFLLQSHNQTMYAPVAKFLFN